MLDALAYVHGRGLIHRDIAPDNIFICDDGRPVLIDFGALSQDVSQATRQVGTVGVMKAHYTAPDQVTRNALPDPTTDVYSIGAVLYEALTGRQPEDGSHRLAEVGLGSGDPYRPLAENRPPAVSAAMALAIDACLALRRRDRPQSIAELMSRLDWESGRSAPAPAAPRAVETVAPLAVPPLPALPSPPPLRPISEPIAPAPARPVPPSRPAPAPSRAWPALGALAAAGSLIALVVAVTPHRHKAAPPSPRPAEAGIVVEERAASGRRDDRPATPSRPEQGASAGPATRSPPVTASPESDPDPPPAVTASTPPSPPPPRPGSNASPPSSTPSPAGSPLSGQPPARQAAVEDPAPPPSPPVQAPLQASLQAPAQRPAQNPPQAGASPAALAAAQARCEGGDLAGTGCGEIIANTDAPAALRARAHRHRGSAALNRGEFEAARTDLSAALRLDPSNADAHLGRGLANQLLGDLDQALSDFEEATRLSPALVRPGTYFELAEAFRRQEKAQQAVVAYTRAVQRNPRFANAYVGRARALQALNNPGRALQDVTEAVRIDPNNPEARQLKAEISAKVGARRP